MTTELMTIQFSFVAISMIFAYLAINFMESKHSVLFPFFLIASIVIMIVMIDNDNKIIDLSSTNINSTRTGVNAVYGGLNTILYVMGFYVLIFLIWSIGSYLTEIKLKNKKGSLNKK